MSKPPQGQALSWRGRPPRSAALHDAHTRVCEARNFRNDRKISWTHRSVSGSIRLLARFLAEAWGPGRFGDQARTNSWRSYTPEHLPPPSTSGRQEVNGWSAAKL